MNSRYIYLLPFMAFMLSALLTAGYAASPEFGKASYYSNKFEGRKTANGEIYKNDLLTCAHKTLKFGTMIRVTRLDNGLSVVVRVNDRGPKREGFVVDLSYSAALNIDMIKSGVVNVKVEMVEPEDMEPKETPSDMTAAAPKPTMMPDLVGDGKATAKSAAKKADESEKPAAHTLNKVQAKTESAAAVTPAAAKNATAPAAKTSALYSIQSKKATPKGFAVQIGSFTAPATVLTETEKLNAKWPGKVLVKTEEDGSGNITLFKIMIGAYATKKEADAQQKVATKKGYAKCYVVNLQEN